MRITVLGCTAGYPTPHGGTSAYLLEAEGARILVDCGAGALAALQRLNAKNWYKLDAVVISHMHGDHDCELSLLGYARDRLAPGETLPLYCTEKGAAVFEVNYAGAAFEKRCLTDRPVKLSRGMVLFAFPTQHAVDGYSLRFEAAGCIWAYSGDTRYTPALEDCAKNADLLICNTPFLHEELGQTGHLSALQAGQIAAACQVKGLALAHIFPPGVYREQQSESMAERLLAQARQVFQNTTLAMPDMVFHLPV